MIRGIAKWHVFIPHEAFFGCQKRTSWGHMGQNHHILYPHDTGKTGQFSKQEFSVKCEFDWV